MLEFLKVRRPDQIRSILETYDPLKDTWIVSDLKSKQEIQNQAIKKYSYFTDEAILRVSDFWRLWLRRLEPTLTVVGSDFIRTLVQHFVDIYGEKLDLLDSEVSTLNRAIQEFAPLILHPASDDLIQEWLSTEFERTKSEKKWQKWYQISKIAIKFIMQEHRAIDSKWSAAYLQSCETDAIAWPRRIFLDLGSELSSVEMGLFKTISQKQDVIVISPEPTWKSKFENLLGVYKYSYGYGNEKEISLPEEIKSSESPFIRLSTQLSEVKYVTSKVREWLDNGIQSEKIAIISSDIERYWPVLQHFLDEEGIDYRKDTVASANSLGDIQNLLAALKNFSSDVSWDSLEKSYFARNQEQHISYEKFKSLFYQLYDEEDLGRDLKIKELFFKKVNFKESVERDEFLSFLIKTWIYLPNSSTKAELFEFVFKDLISQSLNIKMKMSRWISFLKNRLTSKELILKRSSGEGVYVLSLMSAQMLDATHKIYIGLNEELYSKKQTTLMNLNDASAIKTQFDLAIDCSEESSLDFNLRWQALTADANTIFTSAHLSFESDPLNASLFFIEKCPQSEIEIPQDTRIDQLQKAFQVLYEAQIEQKDVSTKRIKQDLEGFSSTLTTDIFRSLSASDFENYARCSFKLLASKGFKLRDYSQVGIDLDNRDKGSLAHALFEYIIKKLQETPYVTEAELSEFLEKQRNIQGLYLSQDNFWLIQKKRFIKTGIQFYDFEKNRTKVYSSEVEKDLTIYYDLDSHSFQINEPKNYFKFNLRADRIDTHKAEKYRIIYDYKSSSYSTETSNKWLSEFQFQMLLYLTALKLNVSDPDLVKGALYYFYKNFNISRGLIAQEVGLADFGISSRSSSLYDADKYNLINDEFTMLTSKILSKLNKGEFSTKPYDLKICDHCDWSKMCRAPHLN